MHVDIKKLGNIPDGGGWRSVGRTAGNQNRQATTDLRKSCKPVIGYSYIHSAVDDHSRLAYSEVLPDERQTPRSASGNAPRHSSPATASPSNGC